MRKLTLILAAAGAACLAAPVAAHPEDEFGSFSRRGPSTAELAQGAVERLISEKKLPASWSGAKLVGFDFRTKNGVDQYVVVFENAAIRQPAKRKLYVLMTPSGSFISANHRLI